MQSVAAGTQGGPAPGGLLERSAELSMLVDSLAAAERTSSGRILLVAGEAGVGKTVLVRKFCDDLTRSTRVLRGACDPLFTPRPLGPFLDVAREAGGELEALVESGALPYEVVTALAHELTARTPTVFVLEDLHWADDATLDVLRLLARRVERVPVLVVASYRDDELDRTHPLRLVLGELATNNAVTRLKLSPLSPAAVAELAEPYDVDADELYRKTAGNPFFVVEALAAGAQGIPETVKDAVLARAARLSLAGRTILDAVAVVPPQAELWLLEAVVEDEPAGLDECLASGILTADSAGVAFRHELSRLAVEDSIAPHRRVDLHRRALAALVDPPGQAPDLARLAHHAEAAGDVDAVLRYAPRAADRAACLGAHREAAAQYARALLHGDRLPAAQRAELLERRSHACYLTDQNDAAVEAIEGALECRRELGDRLGEGDALRWLSQILWCPGRTAESAQASLAAVTLLEDLPPGRELAWAYANHATTYASAARAEEAVSWAGRALELAERLGETEIAVNALNTIGACDRGAQEEKLEQALERAREAELDEQASRTFLHLVGLGLRRRRYSLAKRHLQPGLDFCSDRGLERDRLYLLAYRARLQLDEGLWTEAAESATAVLRVPCASITPRIWALVVLGLVRARRGDPGQRAPLDEAWALAEPTGELPRLGPVAAARAEAAWLLGDRDGVADGTDKALELALERKSRLLAGELAVWRRRAGLDEESSITVAEPYALQLAGNWSRAAALWTEIGCPYEAALALADGDAEEPQRRGLEALQELGAQPAAAIVARRLREGGARGLPRGPRRATRRNPAGLTSRQLEVLALLAGGMRTADIASQLVLSERTVDHHVAAILRKLDVRTRAQASAEAVRLGLAGQET